MNLGEIGMSEDIPLMALMSIEVDRETGFSYVFSQFLRLRRRF